MIAPDLAAPGPRPAPARTSRAGGAAEAPLSDAPSAHAETVAGKQEVSRDFEAVLDEDAAEPAAVDPAAAAAAGAVAATPVDPPLTMSPPAPTSPPEAAAREGEAPTPIAVPTVAPPAVAPLDAALPAGAPPPGAQAVGASPATARIAEVAPPAPDTAPPRDARAPEVAAESTEAEPVGPARAPSPTPSAAVPVAGSDSRVAHPDAASGTPTPAPTLAPAVAADWRLSAEAVAQSVPRDAAGQAANQPRELAAQITLAIGTAEERKVEIRLDPPELGRVHIELTPTEHGLRAVVMAERPETQDLLRRHAEVLAKDLGAAGYESVSLDFAAGGRDAPGDADRRSMARSLAFAAVGQIASGPDAPSVSTRGAGDGALDIRL